MDVRFRQAWASPRAFTRRAWPGVSTRRILELALLGILTALAVSCSRKKSPPVEAEDPPEVVVGERLFLETRFAEFFFRTGAGGDPVMNETAGVLENLPGPFVGRSMNCRACHLVDEHEATPGGGVRSYADFARRSPIPDRADGKTTAPRNSPPLVNSAISRNGASFFHFDGEFATMEDLVRATLTGRNYGWLPAEQAQAVAHIAGILRTDNGTDLFAADLENLPYGVLLRGTDPAIPAELRLPVAFRVDVYSATDQQVLDAVAALIAAYVNSLLFSQDSAGEFNSSPFDAFLAKNGLPRMPDPLESDLDYARRLRVLLDGLAAPAWVTEADGAFSLHDQAFQFGPRQLQGLKIFLAEPAALPAAAPEIATGGIGNCIACHAPPKFSDFGFHNIGSAQREYDGIHGVGAFAALSIPSLAVRNGFPDLYLPASPARPLGQGPFLAVPSAVDPSLTDLGLWNVYANDAVPGPQPDLQFLFGAPSDGALALTLARFKTAGLRDLGQSAPYFHTGQADSLESVIGHYLEFSTLARAGSVRNGDPELTGIALKPADIESLRAFLRSLNEDYR